jgi:uncharacterized protein with von Willebrand factor type A (vWA) domain
MFTDFLYLLRDYGMKTSLNEWNSLLDALELNLNHASLLEFYYMSRAILVKKESDYDKFDQAFFAYFKRMEDDSEFPDKIKKWLAKAMPATPYNKESTDAIWGKMTLEEIRKLMEQRLREQKEAHNGGKRWIGTGGQTAFGHSGYAPKGIRVLGEGHLRNALKIAEERNFRDFRNDDVLQIRQFQVALRKLRLLSNKDDAPKTELDIDATIEETCKQAGQLKIIMDRPRKNQTKLLLLMDSGGSMWSYADLCSRLFKAVKESTQLKDLKTYYFHNCFYDEVFKAPSCRWQDRVKTEWILHNIKPEYKVIIVGDASMGMAELLDVNGNIDYYHGNEKPGIYWLQAFKKHYPAIIWLNPLHFKLWSDYYSARSLRVIKSELPMFPLTVSGLEDGIRELLKKSI